MAATQPHEEPNAVSTGAVSILEQLAYLALCLLPTVKTILCFSHKVTQKQLRIEG